MAPTWFRYLELGVMALLAPGFLFPSITITPWLMAVVLLLWVLRWAAQGTPSRVTPLNAPLLLLLGMLAVSITVTYDPGLSFPKISGLFYGIALTFTLMNHLRTPREMAAVAAGLLLAGLLITGVSLVGTRWSAAKVPALALLLRDLYPRLPALLRGIPRAEAGFNPNQVAGTLILFVPLAGTLLGHYLRHPRLRVGWLVTTLICALIVLGAAGAIVLTQSRLALIALTVILPVMGLAQGRWGIWAAVALLLIEISTVAVLGPGNVRAFMLNVSPATPLDEVHTWASRVEIWRRSLRVIADHPLTGVGFDTLSPIIHSRYPTFVISAENKIWHAHNILLQVALDLGLPGLVGYLALLMAWVGMQWDVWHRAPNAWSRALAAGLLLGILAQMLRNTADAIGLGQKPGILVWVFLGLGAALWLQMHAPEGLGGDADQ